MNIKRKLATRGWKRETLLIYTTRAMLSALLISSVVRCFTPRGNPSAAYDFIMIRISDDFDVTVTTQLRELNCREGSRYESHSAQSTQDRRKLLKRTRSLAVISEDESRQERDACHFRLGQSTFDLPRRHQLIPRAKLIDRNSLKDRWVICQSDMTEPQVPDRAHCHY